MCWCINTNFHGCCLVAFQKPLFNDEAHVLPARSVAFTCASSYLWTKAGAGKSALAPYEPIVTVSPDCKAILSSPSLHRSSQGGVKGILRGRSALNGLHFTTHLRTLFHLCCCVQQVLGGAVVVEGVTTCCFSSYC